MDVNKPSQLPDSVTNTKVSLRRSSRQSERSARIKQASGTAVTPKVVKTRKPKSDGKKDLESLHGAVVQSLNESGGTPGKGQMDVNLSRLSVISTTGGPPNHMEISILDQQEIPYSLFVFLDMYKSLFNNYIKMVHGQRDQLIRDIEAEQKKRTNLIAQIETLTEGNAEMASLAIGRLQTFL